jgi:hypothetical protein
MNGYGMNPRVTYVRQACNVGRVKRVPSLPVSISMVGAAGERCRVNRTRSNIGSCSVTALREPTWQDHIISIHEAGHVATARYFGLKVRLATMGCVHIASRPCRAPDDCISLENLIVNVAGIAATTCFLNYTDGGVDDQANSRKQLRRLGAGYSPTHRLMTMVRKAAAQLVGDLKDEIYSVADALHERRILLQDQIDALL